MAACRAVSFNTAKLYLAGQAEMEEGPGWQPQLSSEEKAGMPQDNCRQTDGHAHWAAEQHFALQWANSLSKLETEI